MTHRFVSQARYLSDCIGFAGCVKIPSAVELSRLTQKKVERILAHLQRDNLVKAFPYFGNRCIYALTPRGARKLGLNERRFVRAPAWSAIAEAALIAASAAKERQHILTAAELPEVEPGLPNSRRRYFLDHTNDYRLSVIVPDYGHGVLSAWRAAKRVRKEIDRHRASACGHLVREHKLQFVLVTPFGSIKGEAITEILNNPSVRCVAVEGLEELFMWGAKK